MNGYKVLIGSHERNRPLRKHRRRRENNIKLNVGERVRFELILFGIVTYDGLL
jgi:hypothetical protein